MYNYHAMDHAKKNFHKNKKNDNTQNEIVRIFKVLYHMPPQRTVGCPAQTLPIQKFQTNLTISYKKLKILSKNLKKCNVLVFSCVSHGEGWKCYSVVDNLWIICGKV